jgi:hypothetical protein
MKNVTSNFMRLLLTCTFSILCSTIFSQKLIPEAQSVKIAFEKLGLNESDKNSKLRYIASFPSNAKTFIRVFNPKNFDQLYSNSYKYIEAFEHCATDFPTEVINKCIDIGKELVWDADAVGDLQQLSVSLAAKYPNVFIKKYNTLSSNEQDKLILFYADVENHDDYKNYQNLIDRMKKNGDYAVSRKLEVARVQRIKVMH